MVKAFNQGFGDIFLISLKAGGTGFNLTGADAVIHLIHGGILQLKAGNDRPIA